MNFTSVLFLWCCCILSSCSEGISEKTGSTSGIPFTALQKGYQMMAFLASADSKTLSDEELALISQKIATHGLISETPRQVLIGNNAITELGNEYLFFKSADSSTSIYIHQNGNEKMLDEHWQNIRQWIGSYTGIQYERNGYYYLKVDHGHNTSLSATFRTSFHIINVRTELPFELEGSENFTNQQYWQFATANDQINAILEILSESLATKSDLIYKPLSGRTLAFEERLYGLISFWSEAKYNFAFFDQVPDLNWDETLLEYIPKIKEEQSNYEYYRLLQQFCAELNDGHTSISLPYELSSNIGKVPIKLKAIESEIYIVDTDQFLASSIPLGSVLQSVDSIPVSDYLINEVYPFVSASTETARKNEGISRLLEGPLDSQVTLQFETPAKQSKKVKIRRSNQSTRWLRPSKSLGVLTYKQYNEVAYIGINTFGTDQVVEAFRSYLDSVRNSKYLVIDLRKNGGGNSLYGYEILKHFADQPFLTSTWKTREHKAAFKAWGSTIKLEEENLTSWQREAKLTYEGNYWHEALPDTIRPIENNEQISVPTVILIGNNTASAAEDFLIAAENISLGSTIGDSTFGSTGQPLFLRLPGGGLARICTKKDTYPDGTEFVGYGIPPDFFVKETIEDVLNEKDVVLDFALNYLRSHSH